MSADVGVILAAVRDEQGTGAVVGTARSLGVATGHAWGVVRTASAGAALRALHRPGVVALVVATGPASTGTAPLGLRIRTLVERARKPVVLVPPGVDPPDAIRRVLLPLEGTPDSSRPVVDELVPLLPPTVRLQVLHVFTPATLPRMLDRPVRDLEMLGRAFTARHCPPAHEVELHHGSVAARVVEIASTGGVDLVALSWSQVSSGERARVVRSVLASSPVPVVLLPVARAGAGGERPKGPTGRHRSGPMVTTARRS